KELLATLSDPVVVLVGPFGLRAKGTMKEFEESEGPDVDAIEGYCMAFRRSDALAIGGFDPKFRFYRMADVAFSFRMREHGGRAVVSHGPPVLTHEHSLWESTAPLGRDRVARRDTSRFLYPVAERENHLAYRDMPRHPVTMP